MAQKANQLQLNPSNQLPEINLYGYDTSIQYAYPIWALRLCQCNVDVGLSVSLGC
jgi:hypothetical protein